MRLAIPAFGALVIEPLLLLTDSAIVGYWSTEALAGLGLAQTVLLTVVGLCVFLAYSTTAAVSRALGAGRTDRALEAGVDAVWLGAGIGAVMAVLLVVIAPPLLGLWGAPPAVTEAAIVYLRVSALGIPAMLVVQAATGVIRGLQDTRTPLVAAVGAAILNIPLSIGLVHGLQMGVAGAAIGTVVAQTLMAAALAAVVVRSARRHRVDLSPDVHGILGAWRDGVPMLVRTLSMRVVLIVVSVVALGLGTAQLAAHQIVLNLWSALAFALDALAIAGQALTGRYLGAGDAPAVRATTRRLMGWGVLGGTVAGLVVLALSWALPWLFTPDPAVQSGIRTALIVVAIGQPLAGFVYVMDGVLMGAGDAPYLAKAGVVVLALFLPAAWLVHRYGPEGDAGLLALWLVYGLWYMGWRGVTLWLRGRQDAWMRLGH
jgi:putative MATE family efflux protein